MKYDLIDGEPTPEARMECWNKIMKNKKKRKSRKWWERKACSGRQKEGEKNVEPMR